MKVDFVTSDNGDKALYVNGRLHYQGYSIPDSIWLGLLKGHAHEVPAGAIEEMGEFPLTFSEILWTAPEPLGPVDVDAATRSSSFPNQ